MAVCHKPHEGDSIPLYREIEIPGLSPQQEIANDSSDKKDGQASLVCESADLSQYLEVPRRQSVQRNDLLYLAPHGAHCSNLPEACLVYLVCLIYWFALCVSLILLK
jgi:hypothetical protein